MRALLILGQVVAGMLATTLSVATPAILGTRGVTGLGRKTAPAAAPAPTPAPPGTPAPAPARLDTREATWSGGREAHEVDEDAEGPAEAPAPASPPRAGVSAPAAPPAGAFSPAAAQAALDESLVTLPVCRIHGVTGPGTAEVLFAPDGSVSRVALSRPFAGSPAAACVTRRLAHARVPAFEGEAPAVRVRFTL